MSEKETLAAVLPLAAEHPKVIGTRLLLNEMLRTAQTAIAQRPPDQVRAILERNRDDLARDLAEMFAELDQGDPDSCIAGYERLARVIRAIFNIAGQGVMPVWGRRVVKSDHMAGLRTRKKKNLRREEMIDAAAERAARGARGAGGGILMRLQIDLQKAGYQSIRRSAFHDRVKVKKSGS
jgi:hypothetical protein